jgi:ferredoxin-NADP reductase
MLRFIADTGAPYDVTLVYSNRDRASTAFLDELDDYAVRIPGFRAILTMTDDEGWEGETRRIDADLLAEHLGDLTQRSFIVAGPPEMAQSVADSLAAAGVPEEQVLFQRFSGY